MILKFTADDHKYVSTDSDTEIKWLSVTSFVALFKQPFDKLSIAKKASANRKSKWFGMDVDNILSIWSDETNRATTLGSWYHDQREEEIIMCDTLQRSGIDLPIVRPILDGNVKLSPDQSLVSGVYPEHLMYLKSAKICGQADRVEVVDQKIDLYDYKTNKKIDTKGYTNWEGVTKKMLGPVSHLDDCNLNHYALQLSTYMYIMQKHNHQLQPGKIEIHHVIFEIEDYNEYGYPITAYDPNGDPIVKEVVPYDLPYYKSEVRAMIKYIKANPELLEND